MRRSVRNTVDSACCLSLLVASLFAVACDGASEQPSAATGAAGATGMDDTNPSASAPATTGSDASSSGNTSVPVAAGATGTGTSASGGGAAPSVGAITAAPGPSASAGTEPSGGGSPTGSPTTGGSAAPMGGAGGGDSVGGGGNSVGAGGDSVRIGGGSVGTGGDSSSVVDETYLPAAEMAVDMGYGTNIANTFENTTAWETGWGMPAVSREYIDGMAANGIKTVRVPVAWDTFSQGGVIPEANLARVHEVAQWIVDANMYCIIDIHWDGGWIRNEGTRASD